MLDGILGRGFVPKGKSLIKLTKNRIDVLRRKRSATIKFLKKDLADLLANGLDVNAYNRAGGLLDELKHLWNLDFVEKCCDFVYKHLSTIEKIRECPEDCREAVSSLMLAASAFSELPELRELRHMFHEKYGDSLELFVNQELVESLSTKPFSSEKKVKLMEDVTLEFSIPWNSKAFEQRISRHNDASVKELNKKHHGLPNAVNDKYKSINEHKAVPRREINDMSSKERSQGLDDKHGLNGKKGDASKAADPFSQPAKEIHQNGRRGDQYGISCRERTENAHHSATSESRIDEVERNGFIFQSRLEPSREGHVPLFNDGDTIVMKVKRENLLHRNGHQNGKDHDLKKTEEGIAARTPKPSSSSGRDAKLSFAFKQESFFHGHKQENCAKHVPQKSDDNVSRPLEPGSFSQRAENIDHGSRNRNNWVKTVNALPAGEGLDRRPLNGRLENASVAHHSKSRSKDLFGGNNQGAECDNAEPMRTVREEETERLKPFFNNALPPPYVKPHGTRKSKAEAASYSKATPDSNSEMAETSGAHPEADRNGFVPERANDHIGVKENGYQVEGEENALPKRRSSRRRHSKTSSRDEVANPEDHVVTSRRTRSRRREQSKKGLQVLVDDEDELEKDEEEMLIDNLLMHYSQKPSSYDEMKTQKESKSRRSRHNDKEGERRGSDDTPEMLPPPSRSFSLPNEQSGPSESKKVFARAASFQPDRPAKHVHPKLPDYDDLAARFASLKGR